MRIAVYGATGYTGKLVVAEAVRRGLDVVLSGRSREKLAVRAAEFGLGDTRPAAVDDPAALATAFDGCAGVVNCAGPFTMYGEPVVRAAIGAGCHYVDTTGEQDFIQRLFDGPADAAARGAGVTVVPAMGFDIVPGDVIAHLTARGREPLERLTIGYSISGFGATRGTMHSGLGLMAGDDMRFEGGEWVPAGPMRRGRDLLFPGRPAPTPTVRFPGGEVITVPRHVKARQVEVVMDLAAALPAPVASAAARVAPALGAVLRTPVRGLLDRVIDRLPEGPREDKRRASSFTLLAEAVGSDGRTTRGHMTGTDVYGHTASLAVEGITRLCGGGAPVGVQAVSQAFDVDALLPFLASIGFEWSVD
jgi:short subunit dehydrogenase-like uncharacterized protein